MTVSHCFVAVLAVMLCAPLTVFGGSPNPPLNGAYQTIPIIGNTALPFQSSPLQPFLGAGVPFLFDKGAQYWAAGAVSNAPASLSVPIGNIRGAVSGDFPLPLSVFSVPF